MAISDVTRPWTEGATEPEHDPELSSRWEALVDPVEDFIEHAHWGSPRGPGRSGRFRLPGRKAPRYSGGPRRFPTGGS